MQLGTFESNRLRRLAAPLVTRIRQSPALSSIARSLRRASGAAKETWPVGADTVEPRYQVDFKSLLPPSGFAGNTCLVVQAGHPIIASYHRALKLLDVPGRVLDPAKDGFYDDLVHGNDDVIIYKPSATTNLQRQMSWEKALPLYDNSRWSIHPRPPELRIYESKRELFYFLKLNGIPHPETHVFFDVDEALEFAEHCELPQVFKTNTGASSKGVEIFRDRRKLIDLVRDVFRRHYIKRSLWDYRDIDYGYVLLQKFLAPVREFRVIKVGESWFTYEKMPGATELMSGSGVSAFPQPSEKLLNFCRDISKRFAFNVMSFDVFQSGEDGAYLINEMQTWFGSYDNSKCTLMECRGASFMLTKRGSSSPDFSINSKACL